MESTAPPLTTEYAPPDREIIPPRFVSPAWRRAIAYAVDKFILGTAAVILTFPFFKFVARLGSWSAIIGCAVDVTYFAILDSQIGNGQSPGKRLMNVQVVDVLGKTISFDRSLLRSTIFLLPVYVSMYWSSLPREPAMALMVIAIATVACANYHLVLFNHDTRQGLHDLAAGSFVTGTDRRGAVATHPIWAMHWLIFAMVMVILILAGLIGNTWMMSNHPELKNITRALVGVEGAQQIRIINTGSAVDGNQKRILEITVVGDGKSAGEEAFADRVVKQIFENYPAAEHFNVVRVSISQGYNFGFAYSRSVRNIDRTPAEWKSRLAALPDDN